MSESRNHWHLPPVAPPWARSPAGIAVLATGALLACLQLAAFFYRQHAALLDPAGQIVSVCALLLPLPVAHVLFRESRKTGLPRLSFVLFCAALAALALNTCLGLAVDFGPLSASLIDQNLGAAVGLCSLVLITLGMACLPAEPLPKNQRLAAGLDVVTLLAASFLCFWVYALFPAITNPPYSMLRILMVAAFTAASLAMIGVLILLMIRRRPAVSDAGLIPLVFGAIVLLTTEILPTTNTMGDFGAATAPVFIGWPVFGLAAAASFQAMRNDRDVPVADVPARVNYSLPFISTGLVGFLLFTSFASEEVWTAHVTVLLPATFFALVLIVIRQSLTARENLLLAKQMGLARDAAETANNSRLQFLANISHDLRTPLNGVLGCTQILLREKDITKKQRGLVKTMQGCAEHLRNLINDLLDLSKLEADRLELAPVALDLHNFTDALIKTFSLEAEKKGISLVLDEGENPPGWIRCDRKRLQQIMGNLISNAVKFTERGGVWVRLNRRQNRLLFEVQDTGFGIHPDKIGELFQPFHIVDERSIKLEGTGLGLSISRKLARKMGGDIEVESTLGKGSKFIVSLPLEEAEPVVEVQRTVVDYQGRRRRILIVDDQPANRVVLRSLLEPLDFLVDEAGSGPAALEHLKFAKPDVILSDLMMPGMDGFEFCRRVADLNLAPEIPCVAISAASNDDVRARSLDAGFCELLGKPVHLDMLLNTLQKHAGIEWTYGIIEAAPSTSENAPDAPPKIVPPSPEEVEALLELARRGVVQAIEKKAEALATESPEYEPFARRVLEFTHDFKIQELAGWLANLPAENVEKSA